MGHSARLLVLTSALAVTLLAPPAAMADAQFSLGAGLQSYSWYEVNSTTNARLLEEEGLRYTGHLAYDNYDRADAGLLIGLDVNGHLGEVDYRGRTLAGVPLNTTTAYLGVNTKMTLGRRALDFWRGYSWDWLGGLGFDYWEREIEDGVDAMSNPVTGYVETYSALYAHAGVGLFRRAGQWSRYLQAGFKYPLEVDEKVGAPFNMRLEPGNNLSGFVSLTFYRHGADDRRDLAVSLYYDTHRFSDSPTVLGDLDANGNGIRDDFFYQPKSDQDFFGIRASLFF